MRELWICEYSPAQKCFHVDTLEKSLEINRAMLRCGQVPSYIPLGVFGSSEEAGEFCRAWMEVHDNGKVISKERPDG